MKNTFHKTEKLRFLPTDGILPNHYAPRGFGSDVGLETLAGSIARYGILEPLLVRSTAHGYELLCGSRRLRAARLLGHSTVPCRVLDLPNRESAELIFAENLHRQPLDPFEEAKVAGRLQKAFPYRLGELADRIGTSPSELSAKQRLLHLSADERRIFREAGLAYVYVDCILHLRDPELRLFAIRTIANRSLSVPEANHLCLSLALHPEEFIPPIRPITPQKRPVRRFVVKDVRFFVNSVDRAIGSIRQAGIDVEVLKSDEENCISYVIKIPK